MFTSTIRVTFFEFVLEISYVGGISSVTEKVSNMNPLTALTRNTVDDSD